MAAHTDPASYTGATYAISAGLPATYDAAGYAATTITYTAIGQVESFPEVGLEAPVSEFRPINGNVKHLKGTPTYGSGQMVMADIPADAGQVILKAAAGSQSHYSMKITYADGEVHYLDVLVSSWKMSAHGENQAMKRTATISVERVPVIVAAS